MVSSSVDKTVILFVGDSTVSPAASVAGISGQHVTPFFDSCRLLWMHDLIYNPMALDDGGEYEVDECITKCVYSPITNTIHDVWVQGIYERTGQLWLHRVPDRTTESLCNPIFLHVPPGSFVYTDELSSYIRLDRVDSPEGHFSVNHSRREYARMEALADDRPHQHIGRTLLTPACAARISCPSHHR